LPLSFLQEKKQTNKTQRRSSLYIISYLSTLNHRETTTSRTQTESPSKRKDLRKHKKIKKNLKVLGLRAPRGLAVLVGAGRKKY